MQTETPLELRPLDFPFTGKDTPKLRARIAADLAHVTERVAEADPEARGILLTGGFARGEGAAIRDAPVNDYDLVVARGTPKGATEIYPGLAQRLEAEVGLHVDLHATWTARLPWVGRKIFWYEAAHTGQVVAGDPGPFRRLPRFTPERIRPDEAVRLLFNRAVGLLEALPAPGESPDAEAVNRHASKALLACGEAALVLTGRYRPTYRERLEALSSPHYEWATSYKLDPEVHAREDVDALWCEAREHLLASLAEALPRCGWGDVEHYPERAPVSAQEAIWGWINGARPRLRPSHAVRALSLSLLASAEFPHGPRPTPEVHDAFQRLGIGASATRPVPALMRMRSRTLQ